MRTGSEASGNRSTRFPGRRRRDQAFPANGAGAARFGADAQAIRFSALCTCGMQTSTALTSASTAMYVPLYDSE